MDVKTGVTGKPAAGPGKLGDWGALIYLLTTVFFIFVFIDLEIFQEILKD